LVAVALALALAPVPGEAEALTLGEALGQGVPLRLLAPLPEAPLVRVMLGLEVEERERSGDEVEEGEPGRGVALATTEGEATGVALSLGVAGAVALPSRALLAEGLPEGGCGVAVPLAALAVTVEDREGEGVEEGVAAAPVRVGRGLRVLMPLGEAAVDALPVALSLPGALPLALALTLAPAEALAVATALTVAVVVIPRDALPVPPVGEAEGAALRDKLGLGEEEGLARALALAVPWPLGLGDTLGERRGVLLALLQALAGALPVGARGVPLVVEVVEGSALALAPPVRVGEPDLLALGLPVTDPEAVEERLLPPLAVAVAVPVAAREPEALEEAEGQEVAEALALALL
jgi:hypothetical protein